jgi:two-component system response regulator NreC
MLIDAQDDLTVVGEAGDGDELLRRAGLLGPDVILLDLTMPHLGGLPAIERLRQECPKAQILVLTMHDDPAYFRAALAAGAHGYVVKRAAYAELLSGIRAVARGRNFVDLATTKTVMRDVVADFRAGSGIGMSTPSRLLSAREQAVLQSLAQGHTNQETAARLRVSVKTVETYRARLYHKLGVRSRAELVRYAAGAGLLTPEQLQRDLDDG